MSLQDRRIHDGHRALRDVRRPRRRRAAQNGVEDPSPHETKLVTVEDGVQLEVLDWGGSGPALVLLAGLGATRRITTMTLPRR